MKNNKLIVLWGLPGSGKTTWAKEYQTKNPNVVRVNKDDLRAMLHNGVHSKGREAFVIEIRDHIIANALVNGHDVIVDDTNLHPKHVAFLTWLSERLKVKLEMIKMTTSLEECIRRDSLRLKPVGEKVIKGMYYQFIHDKNGTNNSEKGSDL